MSGNSFKLMLFLFYPTLNKDFWFFDFEHGINLFLFFINRHRAGRDIWLGIYRVDVADDTVTWIGRRYNHDNYSAWASGEPTLAYPDLCVNQHVASTGELESDWSPVLCDSVADYICQIEGTIRCSQQPRLKYGIEIGFNPCSTGTLP